MIEIPDSFAPHGGNRDIGKFQLEMLLSLGLKPEHRLLDIGCGDLQGGVPLIRYLRSGCYVGLDQTEIAILQGCLSLTEADFEKDPEFYQGGDFGFEAIGRQFDFMIANSVFTHVDLSMMGKGLASAYDALVPGGQLVATIFSAPPDHPWTAMPLYRKYGKFEEKRTYSYRNPFHHPLELVRNIAENVGYIVTLPDIKHPKRQTVLQFTRPRES